VGDHDDWRGWQSRTRAPRALHVSPDGRYAAVVAVHGSSGVVIDVERTTITMRLDRGDHHVHACRFSCAFFRSGGRTLLVHATDANRLEVSDPATGELLTERGPPPPWTGYGTAPPHHLDYFHGALLVSPDGEWIADDGWAWHPYAASPDGLVAWDASTGERLGEVPGFTPSRQPRRARELIELRGERVVRWRIRAAG
jgi:hypothetical protein